MTSRWRPDNITSLTNSEEGGSHDEGKGSVPGTAHLVTNFGRFKLVILNSNLKRGTHLDEKSLRGPQLLKRMKGFVSRNFREIITYNTNLDKF